MFNTRTKSLISGHQRIKTLERSGAKTRIVQTPHTDEKGTVSIGHIDVKAKDGSITKIPFRVVDWHLKREKAANIAANAHGGVFDNAKLALVLADLEDTKEFAIDIVGLDPLTIKSLKLTAERLNERPGADGASSSGAGGKFQEYGEDLETQHECPKCSFKW